MKDPRFDQFCRLKHLKIDIDQERREKYLLERGAIVREKKHLHDGLPEGLVVFDIESASIPDVGLKTRGGRAERDYKFADWLLALEARLISGGNPELHTMSAHNGEVVHYNDDPVQQISRETVERFITEQLEPAEVITGFGLTYFDYVTLYSYTDVSKLIMKTVDVSEEASRFLWRAAVKNNGERLPISQYWLMKENTGELLSRYDPEKTYTLEDEVEKCTQDIFATRKLYQMYLNGSLFLSKNWKKCTIESMLG